MSPAHNPGPAVAERRQQLLCLWTGPAFVVMFGLGFWAFCGFIPPPSPADSALQVAAIYRAHTSMIRIGQTLIMIAAGLQVPWAALISSQMRRIPGCSREFVTIQLLAGSLNSVWFMVPSILCLAAAFRPERDPQLTQTLNDLSWLFLVTPVAPALLQNTSLGLAILSDRRAEPLFPRWAGVYNLTTVAIYISGIGASFVTTGPFAWDGLLAFWLPALEFFSWFIIMVPLLRGAMNRPDPTL